MDLMQQWCRKEGVTEPVNGSWLFAICDYYGSRIGSNALYDLTITLEADITNNIPNIQAIAKKLGATRPSNGSWLQAIIDL